MKTRRASAGRRKGMLVIFVIFVLAGTAFLRFTAATASAEGNRPEPRYKYYTSVQIEPGDSLWSIAETYRTAEYTDIPAYIEEVKEINHLSSDYLQAGRKLCVPYFSSEFKQ